MVFLSSIGAVRTLSDEVIRSDTPATPDSHYGRSKLLAEKLLAEACAGSATEWCALRAPLVYGPGAPGNMQRLIGMTQRGWPLPLAQARAKRSMVYVENLVDALVLCASAPLAADRVFLVSDQESVSVAELLTLIAQLQGRKSRLFSMPRFVLKSGARLVDSMKGSAADASGRYSHAVDLLFGGLTIDCSELHNRLKWRPPCSLREGLARTLAAAPRHPQ
jgi:nucleoside-diphosphate-sugar epimerase